MIVMLQPDQLAAFWDAVKHGLVVANKVPKADELRFCNNVLQNAMTGKAQVWVGYDERDGEKVFTAIGVTQLKDEELTGEKFLYLHTLYAFRVISDQLLQGVMPLIVEFARNSGCGKIYAFTSNQRLQEYLASSGFTQNPQLFVKEV